MYYFVVLEVGYVEGLFGVVVVVYFVFGGD